MPRWLHSSMKCAPFRADFGKQDAVVGEDADGVAVDMGKTADQGRAVKALELVELAGIDDARDQIPGVIGRAQIGRHHAIQFRGIIVRRAWCPHHNRWVLCVVQAGDDAAAQRERMAIIARIVIDDAGGARVHVGAAQIFGADDLACCRLHQAVDRRERSCLACGR